MVQNILRKTMQFLPFRVPDVKRHLRAFSESQFLIRERFAVQQRHIIPETLVGRMSEIVALFEALVCDLLRYRIGGIINPGVLAAHVVPRDLIQKKENRERSFWS